MHVQSSILYKTNKRYIVLDVLFYIFLLNDLLKTSVRDSLDSHDIILLFTRYYIL